MAVSTVIKHFTDGTIELADGTGTPVTLTVPFSQGDFSISGVQESQKAVNVYQSRGTLHSLRLGEKTFVTGSFSATSRCSQSKPSSGRHFSISAGSTDLAPPLPSSSSACNRPSGDFVAIGAPR